MKLRTGACLLLSVLAVVAASGRADATQVLYREVFPAPSSTAASSTARFTNAVDAAWAAERRGGISVNELSIFNGTGSTTPGQTPINSDPDPATFGDSFLFWSPVTHNVLIYTNEYQLQVSQLEKVTWQTRNNTQNDLMRLALQVDGNWYVSDQTAKHLANNATWYDIAFDASGLTYGTYDRTRPAGQRFSGSGLSLPAVGQITGFGLYIDSQVSGNLRIDNYTVLGSPAVPEPATAAMGLLALGGMTLALRRRRA